MTSSSTTILSYDTTSKTAYGPIAATFHYLKKEKDIPDYLVFLLLPLIQEQVLF